MKIVSFTLAAAVHVRDGLFGLLNGGISTVKSPTIPFALDLAALVVVQTTHGSDPRGAYTFEVAVLDADDRTVGRVVNTVTVTEVQYPEMRTLIPGTLSLAPIQLRDSGLYRVRATIMDEVSELDLRVES